MNKTKHEGDSRTQISQKRGRGNKHKTKGAPNKGRNKMKTQDKKTDPENTCQRKNNKERTREIRTDNTN